VLTPGQENEGARPNLRPKEERPPFRHDPAPSFRWSDLIDVYIHPAKIVIFEALQATGQPLSAKELDRMSSAVDFNLVKLSYHLRSLTKIGLLERTDESPTRGSREVFYFLDPDRIDVSDD
jgi:DNA-binding transcriptional ArsR family regulator